ncbi:MAG: glycosyltransferase [Candidatus Omnitrophota bacterium]
MEKMSNQLVSIIIVTAGVKDYLWQCLDSLKEQTYPHLENIVIDNSQISDFRQKISQDYPLIKVYPGAKSLSYCQGLNKGIELSKGNFILCLNDDAALDRKFIEEALRGFLVNSRLGMVSGKILRPDVKTIDSTGLFLTFYRTAKERGYGLRDDGQFEKKGHIFGVCGAAAFYRREMLEDVKEKDYFDPDFHFFYEDLDIAWRAHRKGWKGFYVPTAICYHARGASARLSKGLNKPYARVYLNDTLHVDLIKNRYLAIIKNESLTGLLIHGPAILLYDLCAWSWCLLFRPASVGLFFKNLQYLKDAIKERIVRK